MRHEIIQVATEKFLENGYSRTTFKSIGDELTTSTGHITYFFPTKDHLLAVLTDLLCRFQWKMVEKEADDGLSSVMAICLELTAMAVMCEEDAVAKEFYLSCYTSPLCIDIIRRSDTARAKEVFRDFCPDWTDEQFTEAGILVSGIEYATLMTTGDPVSLETRIAGALDNILGIYGVPKDTRSLKINRVLSMDYRQIGRRMLDDFRRYVEDANEQALNDLLRQ